jgi:hypothetical protein
MALKNLFGLGRYKGPTVPAAVLVSSHLATCKAIIGKVVGKLDPNLKISAVLYDTHDGLHSFEAPGNVSLTACVGKDGATACACHGEGIKQVSEAVHHALRHDAPGLLLMQINSGMHTETVFPDLRRLRDHGVLSVASFTVVFRAVSALNELRDGKGDAAAYARAANQILIAQPEKAPAGVADALNRRLNELNPDADVYESVDAMADVVHDQVALALAQ